MSSITGARGGAGAPRVELEASGGGSSTTTGSTTKKTKGALTPEKEVCRLAIIRNPIAYTGDYLTMHPTSKKGIGAAMYCKAIDFHLYMAMDNFRKLTNERVRVIKDSTNAYTSACMLAIDLHVAIENYFNCRKAAHSAKKTTDSEEPPAPPETHDLLIQYQELQGLLPDDEAFKKPPGKVSPYLVEGYLGNIWARYLGTGSSKMFRECKRVASLPSDLETLKTLPEYVKGFRTPPRSFNQITTFFLESLTQTLHYILSQRGDSRDFSLGVMKDHLKSILEGECEESEPSKVDILGKQKAVLDALLKQEYKVAAGTKLTILTKIPENFINISGHFDWIRAGLLTETDDLSPIEYCAWLRMLIGGLDKAFECLLIASIHQRLGSDFIPIDLATKHDLASKIAFLGISLSKEERELLKKINIQNTLQYVTRDPYKYSSKDSYAHWIYVTGTVEKALSSDRTIKLPEGTPDPALVRKDAEAALALWTKLATMLFPSEE